MDARASAAPDSVELIRGSAVNILATVVGAVRSVFTVLVARLLGSAALGTFSLAWATIDLVSKVAGLGLDVGITPHVARTDAEGATDRSRVMLLTAVPIGLAGSLVVALAVAAALWAFGDVLVSSPELADAILVMLLALPAVITYRICTGFSRGLRIMSHNIYSRGLAENLVTLVVFLLVYAAGIGQLAPVIALVVGTAAGGALALVLALGVAPGRGAFSPAEGRLLVRHSLPVAGYGLANMLMMRLDVLVLGAFVGRAPGLDLSTFGAYCAAVEIANTMRKVRQTFEPIYTPVVARRLTGDDFEPVRGVLAQMGRWTLAFQLPLAAILIVSGGLVLALFGPGFVQAASWLALLVVAQGLFSFFGLAEALLLVRRPELNLANSSLAVALQFGLSLILVPRMGAAGAALAVIAGYAMLGVLRLVELRWLFGLSWPWRSLARPAYMSVIAFGAGLAVRSVVPGYVGWVAAAVAIAVVSVGGWWIVGLDDGDRATLAELRRRWQARGQTSVAAG